MKVVLIGYRACGKSAVGRLLAAELKIPFLDTDMLLEEELRMPVKEIVSSYGWAFFRAAEKKVIRKLAGEKICVVSTGGGVVLSPENIDILKKTGFVVWLNAPVTDIVERLQDDAQTAATRPRFTADSLVKETTDTLLQRIPLYKKAADFSLDTAGKSIEQVTAEIYRCLLETGILAKINKRRSNTGVNNISTGE